LALLALGTFQGLLGERVKVARRNLSALACFIEANAERLDWMPPQAGYTALVRLKHGAIDDALSERLADRGIFLLPGSAFDCPAYIRIGFAGDEVEFRKALAALEVALPPASPQPQSEPKADVILFTKSPVPGFAKTRLAAEIGETAAAELAVALLKDTVSLCSKSARRLYIALAANDEHDSLAGFVPDAPHYRQRGRNLGERLTAAFAEAFDRGAERPVLVGSDSPTLPSHLIDCARRALEHHDVVLGPAEDGGFYAVALNEPHPELFAGIEWSTQRVLQQTLANAAAHDLSVCCLPYWYDVDTKADLARLQSDSLLGPETRQFLRRFVHA
jgi:rSAM/selenodomain-associated transferase 1